MKVCRFLFLVAGGVLNLVAADGPDLQNIDRTITKEPTYQTTSPKYCLAVFGSNAQTRVWLVLDGDTLFIDRNGNLDLTDEGEKVKGKPHHERKGEFQFDAGTITAKGVPPKSRIEVIAVPDLIFVYCHTERQPWQRAVVDSAGYLAFGDKPQTAPVLRFQAPVTIGLRFDHKFKRHSPTEDLDIMVGTPGLGIGSFVRFGHETVNKDIRPVVEIDFPAKGGQTIHLKTTLDKRC